MILLLDSSEFELLGLFATFSAHKRQLLKLIWSKLVNSGTTQWNLTKKRSLWNEKTIFHKLQIPASVEDISAEPRIKMNFLSSLTHRKLQRHIKRHKRHTNAIPFDTTFETKRASNRSETDKTDRNRNQKFKFATFGKTLLLVYNGYTALTANSRCL